MTLQTFSGIIFLAVTAVIYRFSNKKLRLYVMLAASVACYAMFSVQMLGMLAAAVIISYIFGIVIESVGAHFTQLQLQCKMRQRSPLGRRRNAAKLHVARADAAFGKKVKQPLLKKINSCRCAAHSFR